MFIFIGAVMASVAMFQLGSYATIIGLSVIAGKAILALMGVVALVLLIKRYRGTSNRTIKLPRR